MVNKTDQSIIDALNEVEMINYENYEMTQFDISAALTEKEFQARVIHEAELQGWLWYHTRQSRQSNAGYPDLTLMKPDGECPTIMWELKAENGRVSPAQACFLFSLTWRRNRQYMLLPAGYNRTEVIRPADTDYILATLASPADTMPEYGERIIEQLGEWDRLRRHLHTHKPSKKRITVCPYAETSE